MTGQPLMTASDSEPDFEGGAEDNGAREDEGEQDKDEGDNGQHLLVVGSDDTPAARGRNCVLKQWFAEVTHLKDMRGNGGLLQQRPLVRVLATFLNTSTPLFSPLHVKSFVVVYKCESDTPRTLEDSKIRGGRMLIDTAEILVIEIPGRELTGD